MVTKYYKIALTTGLTLAIAFAISCGEHDLEGSIYISSFSAEISSSSDYVYISSSSSKVSSSSSAGSSSSSYVNDAPSPCPDAVTSSNSVTCGGKTYKTVKIGDQVWMAENLNYDAKGSVCGDGSNLTYDDTPTCNDYGRLYRWATVMALPSKCNKAFTNKEVISSYNTPEEHPYYDAACAPKVPYHQGICPDGWHIPSSAEWDALYRSADGSTPPAKCPTPLANSKYCPYESPTAGKLLRAKKGWEKCSSIKPLPPRCADACEDTYNFAALPGGYGHPYGDFYSDRRYTYWWSASEYGIYSAYFRMIYIDTDGNGAYWGRDKTGDLDDLGRWKSKSYFLSVRCLQDPDEQ